MFWYGCLKISILSPNFPQKRGFHLQIFYFWTTIFGQKQDFPTIFRQPNIWGGGAKQPIAWPLPWPHWSYLQHQQHVEWQMASMGVATNLFSEGTKFTWPETWSIYIQIYFLDSRYTPDSIGNDDNDNNDKPFFKITKAEKIIPVFPVAVW